MAGIDPEEFALMRKELERKDEAREAIIKRARGVLRDSKHAIYLVHEGKLNEAQEALSKAKNEKEAIISEYSEMRDPEDVGAFSAALEEYAEAALLLAFMRDEPIPTANDLGVSYEDYLAGLADTTGELVRAAVQAATRREVKTVERAHDFVNKAQGELVQMHFRGQLRKKYDSIKYNLQKIEQALYDLKLRA